jgi:hypothetical protein
MCVLSEGSALLLASRGLLEVRAGSEEYGMERLKSSLGETKAESAHDLCAGVLRHVSEFVEQQKRRRFLGLVGVHAGVEGDSLGENDITTVALVRAVVRATATAGT